MGQILGRVELTVDDIRKKTGCKSLSEVKTLSLHGLELTQINTAILRELTSIQELDISNNQLTQFNSSGVSVPSLKTLDLSSNDISSVEDLARTFPNLENVNTTNNPKLEVADKYKIVYLLPKLVQLDGKNVNSMREGINKLDTVFNAKVKEVWNSHFVSRHRSNSSGDERQKLEKEFIEKLKLEVVSGPAMLKSYREFRLEILAREFAQEQNLSDGEAEEEPPKKKHKVLQVNGQVGKKANEPESRQSPQISKVKKKKKSAECTPSAEFIVSHLLQTHSLDNNPTDRQTQVWGCEFEPDIDQPGHTTDVCATCGGDSVCFIDCSSGKVMKKYKQPDEVFYCVAWTTVTMDMDNGTKRKANLLAAAGLQKDIKIIDPDQLVCFQEIRGHKAAVETMVFHPKNPTWLLSSAGQNAILWDVGTPSGKEFETTAKHMFSLRSPSVIRGLSFVPHGDCVVGACDDGCYVWSFKEPEKNKDKPRQYLHKFAFPGKKRDIPLDCSKCLSDNLVAVKRVEEGCVYIWYSESMFHKNDEKIVYKLPWKKTETPFLKFNFSAGTNVFVAGDDDGSVWLYDLEQCLSEPDTNAVVSLQQVQVLQCPNETTKVFNHVCCNSSLDFIVAVADSNVVCIWKRLLT